MTASRTQLELLAPAKNADIGIAAIEHGADAVYIGGPTFGARASAGNPVTDIERLARHAHRFRARVFVTLNTILRDDELDPARRLAWQAYEAGADALIIQDMGLLELELPPIQLHASTQCDIRTPAKARFLQDAGLSQIVLARELSLTQIRAIAAETRCALEFFVHGALCVAYSGQCYISHAHTGRSANRGECAQACRLPYTLTDSDGRIVAHDKHLLSMKDNDQGANLRALIEAGVSSFKIEGRLKDIGYVKNITAYYRQRLDAILGDLPAYRRASSGRTTFSFTPRPEKSFNRGLTDYFVNQRQHGIEAFDSPGFVGEPIGTAVRIGADFIEVDGHAPIHNGDGLSYFDRDKELVGVRINRVEGRRLYPNAMVDGLVVGTLLYRNFDQTFELQLDKKSAERRVRVELRFDETDDGFALTLSDEDGNSVVSRMAQPKQAAHNPQAALESIRHQLGKFGSSMFEVVKLSLCLSQPWFLPAAALNALRREAAVRLEAARLVAYRRPARSRPVEPPVPYPDPALSYLGNVLNQKARAFYSRHGVTAIDAAFEANQERGDVSLMITKHCLRYSFNLCPKELKQYDLSGLVNAAPMTLINGKERLTLRFDCKRCEMHVMGRIRKSVMDAQAVPMAFHRKPPDTASESRSAPR